jgi:cysteinyl-tRNA synthetase
MNNLCYTKSKRILMLKNILILATSLILISCGGGSNSSDNEEIPSTTINGVEISTWMYQIQDLYDDEIEILDETDYDMLVVEPGVNFKEEPYDTTKLVSALSKKTNGDKRLLIAYIDIGQAEEYRDYWKDDWIAPTKDSRGTPDFLITIDPDGWSGNYPVAYWDERWKKIWLDDDGIIAKLADQGFDGIYLDWIEAYDDERVLEYADSQNIDAKEKMIDFIKELKDKAREINPNFVVISQNAQYLLDYDTTRYASIIDGIATEDTWFYGEGDADWNDANAGDLHGGERHEDDYSTANRIKQNSKYLNLGIPVFTVDYCISEKNADSVYSQSRKNGFIPIVTRVSLSKLTQTPPPEFID